MAKKTFKEKIAEYKAKAKSRLGQAREAGGKMKPFALAGAGGVATHYVLKMVDANLPSVTRSSKYAPAGIALVGALMVNKKSHTAALGIAGAAGLLAAQAWDMPDQPAAQPKPATKGYDAGSIQTDRPDTSALELPDAGALNVDTDAFQADPADYN